MELTMDLARELELAEAHAAVRCAESVKSVESAVESIAGGYALRDIIDVPGRAQAAWRLWRDRGLGNGYRQAALPPPTGGGYTIGPGGATVQRGASYDPRAEQVAAALIESRAAQLRSQQG